MTRQWWCSWEIMIRHWDYQMGGWIKGFLDDPLWLVDFSWGPGNLLPWISHYPMLQDVRYHSSSVGTRFELFNVYLLKFSDTYQTNSFMGHCSDPWMNWLGRCLKINMTSGHRSLTPAQWSMNELVRQVSENKHDKWAQVTDSSTVTHEWISLVGVWKYGCLVYYICLWWLGFYCRDALFPYFEIHMFCLYGW